MAKKARPAVQCDPFLSARESFDEVVELLRGDAAPRTHAGLEETLVKRGTELMRQLLQARLDLLFELERVQWARTPREPGVEVRARDRQLETQLGRVVVWRHGVKQAGEKAARFAMDEELNLPADVYSHPLRERNADQARRDAWDQVVEDIDTRTGGHVPKRQAEQLAVRAAQDFETFYEPSLQPANDALSNKALLVLSSDSKGIRMRPEALRDATRKAAEAEQAKAVRGDPMAAKKARRCDKRMAIVTAVWEQEPHSRTAKQVVANLRPKKSKATKRRKRRNKQRAPRPQNKRLWASVEKDQSAGIAEMFDEADRRDPERSRSAVVLVDGEESQETAILHQGRRRGRNLTLVLDIIHVLSYLWGAGYALCRKDAAQTEVWVIRFLVKLLTRPAKSVVADIRRSTAQRKLSAKEREPVDKCLKYFRRRLTMMRYPEFLAQGLPIATGVIEGACRHLIQDRLGITGARWSVPGAEAVLKLRALHSSGDWKAYWRFHQQQEVARNYPQAA